MQTYQRKQRAVSQMPKTARKTTAQAPPMDALRSVGSLSAIEQHSHPVDLPSVLRAKMENAFGADLSGVRLYESQSVADAGADALAQGGHIAFAPGQLDFTSMQGQSLLGHELSHVVSQARGEARGRGLLEDHSLEARADREGMMAAMGQSIFPATNAAPIAAPAAAVGPVQARRRRKKKAAQQAQPAPQTAAKAPVHLGEDKVGETEESSMLRPLVDHASAPYDRLESLQEDLEDIKQNKAAGKVKAFSDTSVVSNSSLGASTLGAVTNIYDTAKDIKETIEDEEKDTLDKGLGVTGSVISMGDNITDTVKDFTDALSGNDETKEKHAGNIDIAKGAFGMVKGTIDAAKDLKDVHDNDYMDKTDKGLAIGKTASSWVGSMFNGVSSMIPVGGTTLAESLPGRGISAGLNTITNGFEIAQGIKGIHDANSDRMMAERVGREMKQNEGARKQAFLESGDHSIDEDDEMFRNVRRGVKNTASVNKSKSGKQIMDAAFNIANDAVGFAPGGRLAQKGVKVIQAAADKVADFKINEKKKVSREANLNNLALRRKIEADLGINKEGLTDEQKDDIRDRAKYLANAVASGNQDATSSQLASMLKSKNTINKLDQATARKDSEGEYNRMRANQLGMGADENGLLNKNKAISRMDSDFTGNDIDKQLNAVAAEKFEKKHAITAALLRKQEKEQKKTEQKEKKRQKEEKEKAAKEHWNKLPEAVQNNIKNAQKERKKEADKEIKERGIKWYEFSKKKQVRLEIDIKHRAGDDYGGHDISDKQAELNELIVKEKAAAEKKQTDAEEKAKRKKDAANLKQQRKEARAEDKKYKNERNEARKAAGIKWYQFGKKDQFNKEYDLKSGHADEEMEGNDLEGSETANAKLPWYKKVKNAFHRAKRSMHRKHERARDSFINEQEEFNKLGKLQQLAFIMKSPLAYRESRTKEGQAKTIERNRQAKENRELFKKYSMEMEANKQAKTAEMTQQFEEYQNAKKNDAAASTTSNKMPSEVPPPRMDENTTEEKGPEKEDSVQGNNAPESNDDTMENNMSPETALQEEEKRKKTTA